MRGVFAAASLVILAWGSIGCDVRRPEPMTFDLQNGGTASVFLREECLLELTITELADPPRSIGRVFVCPACDCSASSCLIAPCGACADGPHEVAGAATLSWQWTPVDMTPGMRGTSACSHDRVLPGGQYRIDIPVYSQRDDAIAGVNARIVAKTFNIPTAEPVVVPLAAP